jgi:FlaA1/EpsC-like NDP-sugar epimerase
MSSNGERWLLAVLELSLLFVLLPSLYLNYLYPALTSLIGMGIVALPTVLSRKDIIHLPWPVTLATGSVLLLHSLGIFLRFYDMVWWWDTMTHMMATLIIALVVSLVLLSLDHLLPGMGMPTNLVPGTTLACVIFLGVVWEVLEFAFDGALGMNMQYSLDDTATDLSFDILGGGLVALAIYPLLEEMKGASHRMFPPKGLP